MKQKIFNRGKGWYISCTNYKDPNDKAYISLYFPKNTDPDYTQTAQGFTAKDIDIQEAKFTSYQGKPGMTIFKYEELEPQEAKKETTIEHGNDGAEINIEQEDLPFY